MRENRPCNVFSGGELLQTYDYDGEGNLRALWQGGVLSRRYLSPDYQIDVATGQPCVYYRFGGRIVASASGATLRYVLSDHLGSAHAELDESGAETGQRRYYPYGSDRVVIGANDLSRDERYTGQKRLSDGAGNPRAELYHYGSRLYLPGVGVFTQSDTIVPGVGNSRAFDRFGYTMRRMGVAGVGYGITVGVAGTIGGRMMPPGVRIVTGELTVSAWGPDDRAAVRRAGGQRVSRRLARLHHLLAVTADGDCGHSVADYDLNPAEPPASPKPSP
jgi:hypothetical protein